jgi:KilA-N domain
MAGKILMISRNVDGVSVDQRQQDGYVNATQLCKAHREKTGERKDPRNWLETNAAKSAMAKLSEITGIPVIELVEQKTGRYGGTWIHPRLTVRFAMWLSEDFSLQVEDWVHSWLNSAYNPIQLEADADRVQVRDGLKDKKRLEFTGQIKVFLEAAGRYQPGSFHTNKAFWEAHDKLNVLLTTETAKQMRDRLGRELGKVVSEQELLRDYFPIDNLADYAALCQAAANEMAVNKTPPLRAIDIASKQVLSLSYVAAPINFTERIGLVRRRLEQRDQLLLIGASSE